MDKIVINADKMSNHNKIGMDTYHNVITKEVKKCYSKALLYFGIRHEQRTPKNSHLLKDWR